MNKTWVIYKHQNLLNNKVYIGQTCQKLEDRWRKGEGYKNSPYFYNAIKKYGWDNFSHIILENNIPTREIADEKEKYWIDFYDAKNPEKGYNQGDGGIGYTSEEARFYSLKNWENPKLREKWCQPVICINTQKIYESIKEASRQTGVNAKTISLNCKGQYKTAGKNEQGESLVWAFYEPNKNYVLPTKNELNKNRKKVICLTTLDIFSSITEASKAYGGVSRSSISNCCLGKRKTAGQLNGIKLQWSYYEENKEYQQQKDLIGNTNSKKVKCINTGKIYNSLREAGEDMNISPSNISACCHGKRPMAGFLGKEKLHWCFVD